MKKILFILFITMNYQSFAGIEEASKIATKELSFELDPNSIWAFQVNNFSEDYEVKIKTEESNEVFLFDCHYHGETMACHEGHDHILKSNTALLSIHSAERSALKRAERILARSSLTLEDISFYKVWISYSPNDHKSGQDFWIKINSPIGDLIQQCHIHQGELDFSCHYRAQAFDEPSF